MTEGNIDVSAAYDRALTRIEIEQLARQKLLDERISVGWAAGELLLDIAAATGLHYAQVLERVRTLGLSERHPTTREMEPLSAELTAH